MDLVMVAPGPSAAAERTHRAQGLQGAARTFSGPRTGGIRGLVKTAIVIYGD